MSRDFPITSTLALLHVFLVHAVSFQCVNNPLNFAMDIFTRLGYFCMCIVSKEVNLVLNVHRNRTAY